ncbi:hypothetical protein [Halolamina sp.]|uniref:hypothetical protein n=1 Tax=Halolamina sp. TaxID=1940283 RepID=UPI003567323C
MLPFGFEAGQLVGQLGTTVGVGGGLLLFGRVLRRASGLSSYVYLGGMFAAVLGVLLAMGVLEPDLQRARQLARWGANAVRWLGRVAGGPATVTASTLALASTGGRGTVRSRVAALVARRGRGGA